MVTGHLTKQIFCLLVLSWWIIANKLTGDIQFKQFIMFLVLIKLFKNFHAFWCENVLKRTCCRAQAADNVQYTMQTVT